MIHLWRFDAAPLEYRQLSQYGGGEQWVAVVPQGLVEEYHLWLISEVFGVCAIRFYDQPDGSRVYIGAYA